MLHHLSLFSGIEGFAVGLRLGGLNLRTVGYVEQDTWCQKVLQARIAEGALDYAPIIRDIRAADFRPMAGLVDIVTAGFPCQPHSIAGLRAGVEDQRNLWPDTVRVLGEVRPGYVLLENAGIQLRKGNEPAYAYTVLAELAGLGYDSEWGIVSAQAAGAPHIRKRWFCLAHLTGVRQREPGALVAGQNPIHRLAGCSDEDAYPEGPGCWRSNGLGPGAEEPQPERASEIPADAHGALCKEQRAIAGQPPVAPVDLVTPHASGIRCRKAISGPRQWQQDTAGRVAVSQWWAAEPDVVRMVHGFPGRVDRVRALGNSVIPAVVAMFCELILQKEG